MVKVEMDGDVYRIRWQHQLTEGSGGCILFAPFTTCSIWVNNGEWLDEPMRFNGGSVVSSVARCSPHDQFSRPRGRQISLGRATLELFGRGERRERFMRLYDMGMRWRHHSGSLQLPPL